jgi:hypothetical protein
MDIKNFAEWLRLQGHRVYQTESSYWYDAGPRVLQAFPYHWLIQPSEKEVRDLLLKKGFISLRYSTPLTETEGMVSYHVVLHNPYNLEMLRSQARNGVKKGLENCQVEQISFERLADESWILQRDTLERQERLGSMSEAEWRRICLSAVDIPGFEAWAAIVKGELASVLIIARIEDTFCVPYAASHRRFLNVHVNNALFYTVSHNLLSREGVSGIFFTVQSLDAPASVDEFKFRMGLIATPVRQRVIFHPWLKALTCWSAYSLLKNLIKRYPYNPTLAKAEGMLRFNLKGKLPLVEQEWPEVLSEEKAKFLDSYSLHQT